MIAIHSPRIFDLAPSAPLVLEGATGSRVVVCSGTVWLTQYGDARDHVLEPGQSFEIDAPACVVISGFDNARVRVEASAARAEAARRGKGWGWPRRWDRAAHAVIAGAVRRLRLG